MGYISTQFILKLDGRQRKRKKENAWSKSGRSSESQIKGARHPSWWMFYEEHTQHGNAHRNLTVFSAFPLSALLSHPCLRSHSWALLLLSLPVVPDSSLFRHRCVWKKQAGETELSLNFLISVCTSASILLANLSHFFRSVPHVVFLFSLLVQCLVSLGWKRTSQSFGKEFRSCWPWLSWATCVCICKPVLLWWSIYSSRELEIAGLRCLVISPRIQ